MGNVYNDFVAGLPMNNRADVLYEYNQRANREGAALEESRYNREHPKESTCKTFLGLGCGFSGFASAVSSAASGFLRGGHNGALAGFIGGGPSSQERQIQLTQARNGMSNDGTGGLFSGTINLGQLFRLPNSGNNTGYAPGTPGINGGRLQVPTVQTVSNYGNGGNDSYGFLG